MTLQGLIAVCICLLFCKVMSQQPCDENEDPILIIGAGAAGITAAWALTEAGCNVKVFEARNRTGGRAFSFKSTPENEHIMDGIDGGAHWIYAGQDNKIMSPLLNLFNVSMTHVGGDNVYLTPRSLLKMWYHNGARYLTENEVDASFDLYNLIHSNLQNFWENWKESGGEDISVGYGLAQTMQNLTLSNYSQCILNWHFNRHFDYSLGVNSASISLRDFLETPYKSFDDDSTVGNAFISGGIQELWDKMITRSNMDVQLNSRVIEITHGMEGVVVVTNTSGEITSIGGRAAIVTVPLGEILSNRINFVPPIEEMKYLQMSSLGTGAQATIALHYYNTNASIFQNSYGMGNIGTCPNGGETLTVHEQNWTFVSNGFYENRDKNSNNSFFTFYTGGSNAEYAELENSSYLASNFTNLLQEVYQFNFSSPDAIYVSSWSTTGGGSTYIPVGIDANVRDAYAQPEEHGLLRFAGDGACETMPGTIHGAVASALHEVQGLLGIVHPILDEVSCKAEPPVYPRAFMKRQNLHKKKNVA